MIGTSLARGVRAARCIAAMVGVMCAGGASGQSFNVDIDVTTGAGASVPTQAFGGAAGTPGRWNSVPPTGAGPFRLLLLNGSISTVTVTRTGMAASFASNNAATTGEFERLLDDIQNIGNPNPANNQGSTLTIDGLAPGDYELYTYAIAPDSSVLRSIVTVTPSLDGPQTVGGVMPMNALTVNVTYAKHRFSITEDSPTVSLNIRGGTASPGSLNGFQIKQIKPGRLYVQQGITGGDGRAWGSAFGDLASALAQWDTMVGFAGGLGVPEIWVARGTFLPTSAGSGDRGASFVIPSGRRLAGNFRGTSFGNGGEAQRSQRAPGLPGGTILSGDIGVQDDPSDNSRQVLRVIGPVTLDGFTIERGNDDLNAGGVVSVVGQATMVGVTIRNCTSKNGAGGVQVREGGGLEFRRGLIENCQSWTGAGAIEGGEGSTLRVYASRLLRCTGATRGAWIKAGGTADIVNCAFSGGRSEGDVISAGAAARVVNCTIYGVQVVGGGVMSGGNGSILLNSIVWRCGEEAGGIGNVGQIVGAGVAVSSCCVPVAVAGEGNTTAIPRLRYVEGPDGEVGTSDDDFTPMFGSPALESADDLQYASVAPLETMDLLGNPRQTEILGAPQGQSSNKRMDRGAIEAQSKLCAGDFNRNGTVTVNDVFDFLTSWFSESIRADADESGAVGVGDLFEFLSRWFEVC